MNSHRPTRAVQESFQQAQRHATAMADAPLAWDSAPRWRPRAMHWSGLAMAALLAAGGVAAWMTSEGTDPGLSPAPPHADSDNVATAAIESRQANPDSSPFSRQTPIQAVPATTTAGASTTLQVTRESGLIRIVATNAALADAVRALAQATHTDIRGGESIAAVTTPVTLRWEGPDPVAAWDALLGRFASSAVSCAAATCELWIARIGTPDRAAPASPALPVMAPLNAPIAHSEPTALPAPPVVRHQYAPAPTSEETNTETN